MANALKGGNFITGARGGESRWCPGIISLGSRIDPKGTQQSLEQGSLRPRKPLERTYG